MEIMRTLPAQSFQCCVTSPPYFGLRDYKHPGQFGLEQTPQEYVDKSVVLFREVHRLLKDDGVLWLNLGDSYARNGGTDKNISETAAVGSTQNTLEQMPDRKQRAPTGTKEKDLIGIPWRGALALQADGWYLRDAIIWAKPNCMPGSQQDRCTSSYEFVFMFSKEKHYYSDFDAIKTPPRESSMIRTAQDIQAQAGSHRANGGAKTNGAMKSVGVLSDKQRGHSRRHDGFNDRWDNMEKSEQQARPATMRNVWFIAPAQSKEGHFAVMPVELARRCILAGSRPGDTVFDPFGGSGTTAAAAQEQGRGATLCELNPDYIEIIRRRCGLPLILEDEA